MKANLSLIMRSLKGNLSLLILISIILYPTLTPSVQGATRIALLGDRTGGADQAVFQQVIDEIELLRPDVVINVGDLIEGPQPNSQAIEGQWDIVLKSMTQLSCPVYYVPGNNDIFCKDSRRIYTERTKMKPEYSFDFNGLHCVVMDNSEMQSWDELSEERLQWLRDDLNAARDAEFKMVFFHKPFWIENFREGTEDRLHGIFVENGVNRVFSGHYHRYISTEKDGVKYVMIGSSGGHKGSNPYRGETYHYGWLTVDGSESSCAVLTSGHVSSESWLTLDHWMAQETLETCLFSMNRPCLVNDSRKMALNMTFHGDCEAKVGEFIWDTEGTGWLISPSNGTFDASEGNHRIDCAAVIRGANRYPLPRLEISTNLQNKKFSTYKMPELMLKKDLARWSEGELEPLDGHLNDAVWSWEKTAVLNQFADETGEAGVTDPWEIRVVVNRDRLCFGITAQGKTEPLKDGSSESDKKRDVPVFMHDCIYLMVWSEETPVRLTQIIINSHGELLDQQGQVTSDNPYARPEMDPTWNGDITWVVHREADSWTAELSVPMADLGLQEPVERIYFNTLRYQPEQSALATWQIPATFQRESAGQLMLSKGSSQKNGN